MKNKKILIMIFAVVLLSSVLFIGSLISKQDTELDEVKLNDLDKDSFAIMVEQTDGTYLESDAYPVGNYMLDEDLSGCIDKRGKAIANSVSYSNGTVTFKTNSSSYCYVYFSKLSLVKYLLNEETRPSSLWTSTLDGDGYRFVGTAPNNYICFGAGDKDTCVGNTDLYMYRIIGIFEDSNGKQYVKLIKKEALNTAYAWHSSRNEASWGDNNLYTNLNGSYFLSNTTYSYMQNTIWASKIKDWTWSAVDTINTSSVSYYSSLTANQVYYHEMNHANKSSTVGSWTTPSGKIGLMYASDYMLALGESALSYIGSSNYSTLKTGWMFLTKNDSASLSTSGSAAPSTAEGTMAANDTNYGYYNWWIVDSSGYLYSTDSLNKRSVRPVFYLNSSEEYISGTGTASDPFIIDGRTKYTVSVSSTNTSYGTVGSAQSVPEGDSAYIELEPATHYIYSSNTCGGTVSGNTLIIPNVTSDITCTVTFEKAKYTISVSSNSTSYGTVSPSSQTVYGGENATFTLTPATGYEYSSSTCGGTVSGNTLTVKATSNKNCVVYFAKKNYYVEVLWCWNDYPDSSCISGYLDDIYAEYGDYVMIVYSEQVTSVSCGSAISNIYKDSLGKWTGKVVGNGTCYVWADSA